jgi:Flp pilus assembly pilin Flp
MRPRVAAPLSGQGLVEYALIILFISLVAIVGLEVLGTSVNAFFQSVADAFPGG